MKRWNLRRRHQVGRRLVAGSRHYGLNDATPAWGSLMHRRRTSSLPPPSANLLPSSGASAPFFRGNACGRALSYWCLQIHPCRQRPRLPSAPLEVGGSMAARVHVREARAVPCARPRRPSIAPVATRKGRPTGWHCQPSTSVIPSPTPVVSIRDSSTDNPSFRRRPLSYPDHRHLRPHAPSPAILGSKSSSSYVKVSTSSESAAVLTMVMMTGNWIDPTTRNSNWM
jgi:hypothetical protein